MSMYDITGAHDMHIHAAPDLVDRIGDDFTVAKICMERGYKSILIKSHLESTVSRAYLVSQIVPDINVYGSITLNTPIGGLNPTAVEIALKMGAKEIFMPTSYSLAHSQIHGKPGGYKHKASNLTVVSNPIQILDKENVLFPEVISILELARDYKVPVGTAHLSINEITHLVKKAVEIGSEVILTHPHFNPPNIGDELLKELVDLGAKIELCAGTVFPVPGYGRVDQVVKTIKEVGYKNFFITSDAGSPSKPMPPDTLSTYLYCLYMKGIPKDQIDFMFKTNPVEIFKL